MLLPTLPIHCPSLAPTKHTRPIQLKITKNNSPINYSPNQFIKDSHKPHNLHPTLAPAAINSHTSKAVNQTKERTIVPTHQDIIRVTVSPYSTYLVCQKALK